MIALAFVAFIAFSGRSGNDPDPVTPAHAATDPLAAPVTGAGRPQLACGDCGPLCREDAISRAAGKPDALIACHSLSPGVAVALLRSAQIPQLWVITDELLIRADHPMFDSNGRDLRPAVLRDAAEHWPWLWDRLDAGAAASTGATAPGGAAAPRPPAPEPDSAPPSHWIGLATAAALEGPLAGIKGDFRLFRPEEFAVFTDWIETSWPGPAGWRRMAWIDPQCPHCKDLVEQDVIDHFAPRVIMRPREAEARAAAGWLLADPPQLDRFLAFEPADKALSEQARDAQRVLDQLLWELRRDWGIVVPIQALRGNGWIVLWWGAEPPPEPFRATAQLSADPGPA